VKAGMISARDARGHKLKNIITRSVGYENHVMVDIYRRKAQISDVYFSCTDGLSGLVEISEISEEIEKNGPEEGLNNLVSLANSRGGDDNITALAVEVS